MKMGIYFCQNNSSQTDEKGYLKFFIRLCIISNKMAAYLEENIVVIKDCVQKNYTYQQISLKTDLCFTALKFTGRD